MPPGQPRCPDVATVARVLVPFELPETSLDDGAPPAGEFAALCDYWGPRGEEIEHATGQVAIAVSNDVSAEEIDRQFEILGNKRDFKIWRNLGLGDRAVVGARELPPEEAYATALAVAEFDRHYCLASVIDRRSQRDLITLASAVEGVLRTTCR